MNGVRKLWASVVMRWGGINEEGQLDLDKAIEMRIDQRIAKLNSKHERKMAKISDQIEDSTRKAQKSLSRLLELHKLDLASSGKRLCAQMSVVETSIGDINSQLSALRDYSADKQEQVGRLQDGYDWKIMKDLCRRMIRCVDQIDFRIKKMDDGDESRKMLVEISEDLVMALDGSGVEQFAPEQGSTYSGQESYLEVNGKEQPIVEGDEGKIANVLSHGYRLFVNEELSRLIRPAGVIVYERKGESHE